MNSGEIIKELLKAPFFEVCMLRNSGKRAALEQAVALMQPDLGSKQDAEAFSLKTVAKTKAVLELLSEEIENWEDLGEILDKTNLPMMIYAADVLCHYELPGDILPMWAEEFFYERGEWQKKYKKAENMKARAEAVYKSLAEYCNFDENTDAYIENPYKSHEEMAVRDLKGFLKF